MADQGGLLAGVEFEEDNFRKEPITNEERLIVQNLFDTQPERRMAYLKKIGFEMNPKDDNKIRPLGSDISWDNAAEIDPGILDTFKKGGFGALAKESFKDMTDVGWDMVIQNAASAGGATIGATGGATTGSVVPGVGTAAGGLVGGVLGGAAGNVASEALKVAAGDLLLDESIPADKGLMAVQSLTVGAMPSILKGVTKGGLGVVQGALNLRKQSIIAAAKRAGNGLTDVMIDRAAKNPEMFTEEAVQGASQRLTGTYKHIFGIDPKDALTPKLAKKIQPDSVFGQKLAPLNRAANEEISALAMMPEASFKGSELLGPVDSAIMRLSGKADRTVDENAALNYMKSKRTVIVENLKKDVPATAKFDPYNAQMDFRSGREILKVMQDDSFNRELPGSSVIGQIAGGFRQIADDKAAAVGSKLPEINQTRSDILSVFDEARANLTPSKMEKAFVGEENIAKGEAQLALSNMDQLFGSDFSRQVEDGSLQAQVLKAYKLNKNQGSGGTNAAMVSGAINGATKGAGVGAVAGLAVPGMSKPAAIAGAIGGAAVGARNAVLTSTPERAMNAVVGAAQRENAVGNFLSGIQASQVSPLQQMMSNQMAANPINQSMKPDPLQAPMFAPSSGAGSSLLDGVDFEDDE